jgi:hypothetical protein
MNPLRKGTDLLLKASQELEGDFELIIHSQIDLFAYYKSNNAVLSALESLKDRDVLTIITKSVSAPGLYKLGNIYVYPCRLDGLGLTVPEAISSGLPTIIPNSEPMKEFATSACSLVNIDRFYCRKDGYYWPQQLCDIADLSLKMSTYIGDDNLKEKMVLAREHAVKSLNWKTNSAELNQFIDDVKVIPLTKNVNKTYQAYKNYGYRKILTKIERYGFIFSPLLSFYDKFKKVKQAP